MGSFNAGNVFQILYRSQASEHLTMDGIKNILEVSRRKNTKAGISGLLVLRESWFLQLLEGPYDPVMSIVHRIKQDPRHSGFEVLFETRSANERLCGNWSMGYLDPSTHAAPPVNTDALFKIYAMALGKAGQVTPQILKSVLSTFKQGCGDLSAQLPPEANQPQASL